MGNETEATKPDNEAQANLERLKAIAEKQRQSKFSLKERADQKLDLYYKQSRNFAIKYVTEIRLANADLSPSEFLQVMQNDLIDYAETSNDVDGLCNKLALYVCVATEIHGGESLEIESQRKAMKIIVSSRRLNKARKIYNNAEMSVRILALLASFLPDKDKYRQIRKAGEHVDKALRMKDEINHEIVNVFDKKSKRFSLMINLTDSVLSEIDKVLGVAPEQWRTELEPVQE
jgi:hypothetical protein